MKAAVIGCGNISKVHFIALSENPEAEIIAVADIKPERADEAAEKHGARAYYNIDELLENETPDVVHICTPHYLHTEMAVKALEKGINVLTEKPCSTKPEEVEKLRIAQSETGKQVGVCFQNRYNCAVQKAKTLIGSGAMGEIRAVRAFVTWFRDKEYYSDDWHGTLDKECGGVLINQAIHTVDLIQYFGGKCISLDAHVSNDSLKDVIEVEDTATVRMKLENGVTAVLYATTAYSENSDVFIEILTEKGKLRLEGEKLFVFDENKNMTEIHCDSEIVYHGESYWGSGHSALINDFYDCVRSGKKFEIDAFEGGHAAKIVAASYLSAQKNQAVTIDL